MVFEGLTRLAEGGRVDLVPLSSDSKFWALASALRAGRGKVTSADFPSGVLALDPGNTTGVAIYDPAYGEIKLFQLKTDNIGQAYDLFEEIFRLVGESVGLTHVRYEDYRVYGHMTETHAYSNLHTARVIGAIEVACHVVGVRWTNCLAQHAKAFWTDEKLKMCGIYNRGMRHARDAQRHLLRYMGEADAV